MKNLFLSVVLLLTVSFTFATNNVEKISIIEIEETLEVVNSIELNNSLELVKINLLLEDVAVRCCTSSSEDIEVTVCSPKGACGKAAAILDTLLE
jgi:hypothetical protein